ncbi:Anti-sigma regulatory factor (Ser/Thr protein kinase) [Tangfeifania diversioriginum]|uniref:Anti-sigma regulatory factor (Ser/Thr protein kinase) n=1 Tax=Tangfeifania diversioriginum TaxID=1168035 RepID=A0A1M6M5C6_9BACT|nr:ATP-binding protein [Tangfeifania diversioriginum]SHJ78649.1 Anti-sigma regulatory factor (Ser/Thr protein kinase) [Tangfeifania diversioriginum]
MAIELNFTIEGGDFSNAGKASSKIKKVLKQLNIEAKIIKKIVVAVYEAEVNVAAHAYSGNVKALVGENDVVVMVSDSGPGIENVELAMKEGYSTASKEVREMGFGAGMGLANIKRNTDELKIETKVGEGTTVTFSLNYS